MKVLIAGCGYLGKALGKDLVESGASVWGLRRDTLALKSLEMLGITPIAADLLVPASLLRLPDVDYAVLCQAPSKETDNYQKTYSEATRNLLEAFHLKKPRKIILISSTAVYGRGDGRWVDEGEDLTDAEYASEEAERNAKVLLETEALVLSGLIPGVVFRLGGLYGPRRNRLKAIKEKKLKPVFSDHYSNRIHVEDVVSGIRLLIQKGKPNEIYLGVDDEPSTGEDFYSWLYEKMSLPKPSASERGSDSGHASNKRCSNKKMKDLGWRLRYPTYRQGYTVLLSELDTPSKSETRSTKYETN